jgi:hypothetical protein
VPGQGELALDDTAAGGSDGDNGRHGDVAVAVRDLVPRSPRMRKSWAMISSAIRLDCLLQVSQTLRSIQVPPMLAG